MTLEVFEEIYVRENVVILCRTEEEANKLLKTANRFGYRWRNGSSYKYNNKWSIYKEKTCYSIDKGEVYNIENIVNAELEVLIYKNHK